jgi:hypothetical protein
MKKVLIILIIFLIFLFRKKLFNSNENLSDLVPNLVEYKTKESFGTTITEFGWVSNKAECETKANTRNDYVFDRLGSTYNSQESCRDNHWFCKFYKSWCRNNWWLKKYCKKTCGTMSNTCGKKKCYLKKIPTCTIIKNPVTNTNYPNCTIQVKNENLCKAIINPVNNSKYSSCQEKITEETKCKNINNPLGKGKYKSCQEMKVQEDICESTTDPILNIKYTSCQDYLNKSRPMDFWKNDPHFKYLFLDKNRSYIIYKPNNQYLKWYIKNKMTSKKNNMYYLPNYLKEAMAAGDKVKADQTAMRVISGLVFFVSFVGPNALVGAAKKLGKKIGSKLAAKTVAKGGKIGKAASGGGKLSRRSIALAAQLGAEVKKLKILKLKKAITQKINKIKIKVNDKLNITTELNKILTLFVESPLSIILSPLRVIFNSIVDKKFVRTFINNIPEKELLMKMKTLNIHPLKQRVQKIKTVDNKNFGDIIEKLDDNTIKNFGDIIEKLDPDDAADIYYYLRNLKPIGKKTKNGGFITDRWDFKTLFSLKLKVDAWKESLKLSLRVPNNVPYIGGKKLKFGGMANHFQNTGMNFKKNMMRYTLTKMATTPAKLVIASLEEMFPGKYKKTSPLGYIDENLADAFDDYKTAKLTEKAFQESAAAWNNYVHKSIEPFSNVGDTEYDNVERFSSIPSDIIKRSVKLGTASDSAYTRKGHIYGVHTYGGSVDKENTKDEYPVGIDVVIFSIFNTMKISEKNVEDVMNKGDISDEDDDNSYHEPKVFLSSKSDSNCEENVSKKTVWYIQRVKGVNTYDMDYLKDMDRVVVNRKSMDGMLYCIKNKYNGKYLKNSFSSITGKSNLTFSSNYIPSSCSWMIRRVDGHENQYTLFSTSRYSHKDDGAVELAMDLAGGDFITPMYRAVRKGMEFPFNQEFINPFFSSLSTDEAIIMDQSGSLECSWTIVPTIHPGLAAFIEQDVVLPNNKIQISKNLNYVRDRCTKDTDCPIRKYGRNAICERDGSYERVGGKMIPYTWCVAGRKYGSFCAQAKGWFKSGKNTSDCGKDDNGKQLVCKIMFDFNKFNACRYTDKSQTTDQFCGKPEECKSRNEGCVGSKKKRKLGKGRCDKLPNGQAHDIHPLQSGCTKRRDNDYYKRKCKSGHSCGGFCSCKVGDCKADEWCDWEKTRKCKKKYANGIDTGTAQTGCGNNNGLARMCKSNWACGGRCSCKKGTCGSGKYCAWFDTTSVGPHIKDEKTTKKCENKVSSGIATGLAQVGCGNNGEFANACKSNWACGGKCACKRGTCPRGKYCDDRIVGTKTCQKKLKAGVIAEPWGHVGCGNNGDVGRRCKDDWACYRKCSIKWKNCSLDSHCRHGKSCCSAICRKKVKNLGIWWCPYDPAMKAALEAARIARKVAAAARRLAARIAAAARRAAAAARRAAARAAAWARARVAAAARRAAAWARRAFCFWCSDRKLKNNIILITKDYFAKGVHLYTYKWNKIANEMGLYGDSMGFMADEVENKFPKLIITVDNYKAMDMNMLIGFKKDHKFKYLVSKLITRDANIQENMTNSFNLGMN